MKKVLPFLFVLVGFVSTAQIVNIPDANFKNALLNYNPRIDLNYDNQIQVSEAAQFGPSLILQNNAGIADLTGIEAFTSLDNLMCGGSTLTTFNPSGLTNLHDIDIQGSGLTSLDLTSLSALTHIMLMQNQQLSSLNVTGLVNLTNLWCSDAQLTSLDVNSLTNLYHLSCSENQITSLNVSGLQHLNYLYCRNNNLSALNISNCPALILLDCRNMPLIGNNHFTSLDLSNGLGGLNDIYVQNIGLTSLNLSGLSNLKTLTCSQNQLTSLTIPTPSTLQSLTCGQNLITSLDLGNCPLLTTLSCSGSQLTYLNIKNGPSLTTLYMPGNSNLAYVCADDNEVSSIQDYFIQNNMPNVNVNSYCSFTPGGTYNTINGTVTMDLDNNGCGAGDPVLPGLIIKINDGSNTGFASNNNNGAYAFYTNAGNYTITPQTQNPYFNITPASASINFATAGGGTQTADFCISPNGVHPDLDITLIPVSSARPGFDATYKLVYKNKGTQTLSGDVQLSFDDVKLNLISATPTVTTQVTGLLTWTYSNLAPFESRSINIKFNFLPPPTNNINDSISFTVNITPLAADETPLDNGFELRQIVTGSFDPNDKASLEGATFDVTRVGDYAHYLIRFQNTGNAAAENVVVKDMLDNNFNWNTVELIQTSHPCILKQTLGNKLEFIFEGINLPPVTVDEPASHGFIAFKVKTKNTLVLGDSLKNTASIYFDYNLPVITNLAGSVVGETGTIPISIEYFKGAIQSGNHLLNWKVNCTSSQVVLAIERSTDGRKYNSLGTISASNTRCLQPFDFTDNNPAAGINYYRIKMTDVDGKISYSSIIALLNKRTGFEIVNLAPNPVINGTALLNITSAEKQIINIAVSDATGKIVQAMDQTVIPGFTQINMNFSKLGSGMYTITIFTNDQERRTTQFIKQ